MSLTSHIRKYSSKIISETIFWIISKFKVHEEMFHFFFWMELSQVLKCSLNSTCMLMNSVYKKYEMLKKKSVQVLCDWNQTEDKLEWLSRRNLTEYQIHKG